MTRSAPLGAFEDRPEVIRHERLHAPEQSNAAPSCETVSKRSGIRLRVKGCRESG